MIGTRILAVLTVLGLAPGLALLSSAPAGAEARTAQTVSFSSTPPDGADWFYGDGRLRVGYVARASATSGLPVEYSISPASVGICQINHDYDGSPAFAGAAAIDFQAAGTCTIHADQAGNDEYLPAEQVSQSFEIAKVGTWINSTKAVKGVPGLTASTFRATLVVPYHVDGHFDSHEGYPGQVITFSVAGRPVCSAVTNDEGLATCKAVLGLADSLRLRYTATYVGDANYAGVAVTQLFSLV